MADRPFGFSLPGDSGSGSGSSGSSGSAGGSGSSGGFGFAGGAGSGGGSGSGPNPPEGGGSGPFGPLGDPQQFAEALRQFADLMSWQGGPVNWELAKSVARHTVSAAGDPSVLEPDRKKVVDALRLADLWLDEVTSFSTGIHQARAWSRSEWVEATLPVWSKLAEPVADKAVEAMGGLLPSDASEMGGELPAELGQMLSALSGGLPGLAEMMRRIGGMMVGSQTGSALGELAREVVSSTDVGIPLGPEGTAALLPAGVAAFGEGLSVDPEEVRLFLALREAAYQRLFGHVPWLRAHVLAAVGDYARGMSVDASALRDAMPQIDPTNPEALREALSGAALFQPQDTPEQKAALTRLETALALVEGWVATVVDAAAANRLPQAGALAEAIRRRRATGGPAERIFATLVGLELRPRRLREAAALWLRLAEMRGIEGRDAVWAHPDLLPTSDDFDDPEGFARGRPELNIAAWEEELAEGEDSGGLGPGGEDTGRKDAGADTNHKDAGGEDNGAEGSGG